MSVPYLEKVFVVPERIKDVDQFPFSLPFVAKLDLAFPTPVTFFVGENGSGKSTLLESIAKFAGLPVSGGGKNDTATKFAPDDNVALASTLRPVFKKTPRDGYFLRAEYLAHFASLLDERLADPEFQADPYGRYGGKSLHQQSHGESFLAVLGGLHTGLFLFDEPEAALSPQRQLALLAQINNMASGGKSQFIIATHSPILLTFPSATIISFDTPGLETVELADTSHYQVTRGILEHPDRYWQHLSRPSDEA